jgi:cobyric acid synthase
VFRGIVFCIKKQKKCVGRVAVIYFIRMKRFTDQELLNLLDDTESDCVERKQSLKGDTPDRARQAICAFAS